MSVYEGAVRTARVKDAQGDEWQLRFDNAAAIEAELCCREQYGRDIGYLTICSGAMGRIYYAMLAIAYGAAVSAAKWASAHGSRVMLPGFAAFERAFPLTALMDAQGEIAQGILAYLPPPDKKKGAAGAAAR